MSEKWRVGQCLEWTVEVLTSPYDIHQSPVFRSHGAEWYITVCREYSDSPHFYCMKLRQCMRDTFQPFSVTIYVRRPEEDTLEYKGRITAIPNRSPDLLTDYPFTFERRLKLGHHRSGKRKFFFIFKKLRESRRLQGYEKRDVWVQTPSNLNSDPCLESLSQDFCRMLVEDSNHDVEIKCKDSTVKAHKSVLSARSDVFAAVLRSDMVEGRTGLVKLQDMDADVFQTFIRYLYAGTVSELTIDKAKKLYEAGDKYAVRTLMQPCAKFLKDNLTFENAFECLVLADAHSDRDFKVNVISYILDKDISLDDGRWEALGYDHLRLANELLLAKTVYVPVVD